MSHDADHIIGLYERHALAWDSDRELTSFVEKNWMDRFVELLPPRASILDIGCGSGYPIARYFIEREFRVLGVDSSPTMISLCRQRFSDEEWITADMRTLSLNKKFQGIIAWDSFFHLPHEHQRLMFSVFEEHSEAGTAVMFTSGTSHGEAIGSYEGEPLYHASLAPEEYRNLLASHGFNVVSHLIEDPLCGFHTIWLAQATTKKLRSNVEQCVQPIARTDRAPAERKR